MAYEATHPPPPRVSAESLPPRPDDPVDTDTAPLRTKRLLYTGIIITSLGAIAGTVAYVANDKARKAEARLVEASTSAAPPQSREAPIRDIEKMNRITLGSSIAAGALAAVGLIILAVVVVRMQRGSPARRIARQGARWHAQSSF